MSRIHFHSPSGTLDIAGIERRHADIVCRDRMWAAFGGEEAGIELLRPFLPDFWRRVSAREVKYYLLGEGTLNIHDLEVCIWTLALNTAIATGSDAVRLLARLHGQSEVHCWVDGPNRNWLADIIVAGRTEGVLREEMGWEALADFLRSRNDEPVVCSYSVCASFPNYGLFPETHPLKVRQSNGEDVDQIVDEYYDMDFQAQWNDCMGELRTRPGLLEMKPDGWESYYFDNGLTAESLIAALKSAAD
jgi:hypothetical protein